MTQMYETSIDTPISKVLPNQTSMHDYRCMKHPSSFPLARVKSYPTKLQCITLVIPISKGGPVLLNQTPVHDYKCMKHPIVIPISKEGVLHNQNPVHDSKCYKRLFSFRLVRGESYPTKLQCMTSNAAEVLSHSN